MSIEVQLVLGHHVDGTWLSLGVSQHGYDSPNVPSHKLRKQNQVEGCRVPQIRSKLQILSLQSLPSINMD